MQSEIYPPDEGWITQEGKPIKLSILSINKMTRIFTPKTKPPNSPAKWDAILGKQCDWPATWKSISDQFISAHDNKTWLRLAHRGLRLRGNDKSEQDPTCRLCGNGRQSHHHLLVCPAAFRTTVLKLLRATHMNLDSFSYPDTWLTCLNANNQRHSAVQTGIIKIHWNTIYQHITKQTLDMKRFHTNDVSRDFARLVTQRIQHQLVKLKKFQQAREHGHYQLTNPSNSTTAILESIGSLNTHACTMTVSEAIIKIIQEQDPLCEFESVTHTYQAQALPS